MTTPFSPVIDVMTPWPSTLAARASAASTEVRILREEYALKEGKRRTCAKVNRRLLSSKANAKTNAKRGLQALYTVGVGI